jgi:hypothetical protein
MLALQVYLSEPAVGRHYAALRHMQPYVHEPGQILRAARSLTESSSVESRNSPLINAFMTLDGELRNIELAASWNNLGLHWDAVNPSTVHCLSFNYLTLTFY